MYLRATEKQSIMQQKSTKLRCLGLIISFLAMGFSLGATTRRQLVYEAYVSGNRAQWIQVVRDMERSTENKTQAWRLELAEYYYGLSGYYISAKKNELAAETIQKGEALVNRILKDDPDNATAMSYKSALTAFKINLNRLKVFVLGRESLKWLDKALAADPDNIQALVDRGNALIHAPVIFGGDPDKGINMFRRGLSLMEKKNLVAGNWFYLQVLIATADAYKRTGHPEKARPFYERALAVEPRFRLVRDYLLPALDK